VSDEQLDETAEDARPEDGIFLQFAGRERHQAFVRAPRVLMEVPEHGDPEGSPENLLIEGDNLDVMSALRFQYGEQVNVAIVDPPYGGDRQDVRYRDDSTGWLNQMLPTFHLIRELLAETGVMFVHIDDDQLFNLGVLLDDIFDERNRLGVIVWKSATDNNPSRVAQEHEYILTYAKNIDRCPKPWRGPIVGPKRVMLDEAERITLSVPELDAQREAWRGFLRANRKSLGSLGSAYVQWDEGGPFMGDNLSWPGGGGPTYDVLHPRTGKPCKVPSRGWIYPTKERMDQVLADGIILFGPDETTLPTRKRYLAHSETGKLPSVLLDFDGRTAAQEIKRLFPENPRAFKYPKPSALEEYLLSFVADKEALVLDPFGGSGTTAHAVMRLNKRDDGDRRFILIERGNQANNDEYAVELTAERIKRARTVDGLPGGFTFLRVGDEINDEGWAKMQRDEVARVIRQADPSGKGRGLRRINGCYIVGANSRRQAVCLNWGGEDAGAVSREVLRAMFEEVAELGLRLPMRVYGVTCDVAETDDFVFCQLPDEVKALLGYDRTESAA
jgi:adenine-specific DNA-methyltransferase